MSALYTKVILAGHVHNHPDRIISEYFSAPLGVDSDFVFDKIEGFRKAFTLLTCEFQTMNPRKDTL